MQLILGVTDKKCAHHEGSVLRYEAVILSSKVNQRRNYNASLKLRKN